MVLDHVRSGLSLGLLPGFVPEPSKDQTSALSQLRMYPSILWVWNDSDSKAQLDCEVQGVGEFLDPLGSLSLVGFVELLSEVG